MTLEPSWLKVSCYNDSSNVNYKSTGANSLVLPQGTQIIFSNKFSLYLIIENELLSKVEIELLKKKNISHNNIAHSSINIQIEKTWHEAGKRYLPTYLPSYLPTYLPTFLPTYLPMTHASNFWWLTGPCRYSGSNCIQNLITE